MRKVALALAVAAVAVAAPRLVLIFLEADSLEPASDVRAVLLGASGAALALVLTGGGAYLVHAIVRVQRFQRILFALWIVILTCMAFLITPRLVAGLEQAATPLARVLDSALLRWSWAAVAVLAAELVATGCMLAYAAESRQQQQLSELLEELEQTGRRSNRLEQQLRQAQQQLEQHRPTAAAAAAEEHPAAAGAAAPEEPPAAGAAAPAGERPAAATEEHPAAGAAAAVRERPAAATSRTSSSPAPKPAQPIPCRYGCGYVAPSIPAERGHLASCPKHPRLQPPPSHA